MITEKTEILIIGGGIAGCIAAISLIDTYQVTLVDKLLAPMERIGESLAPATQRILKELDLLEGMENQMETLYRKSVGMQSYWGSHQVHLVDDLRNPDGFVKNLDRQAFETYLRKTAEARGVHCLWGSKLYSSTYEDSHWKVQLRANDDPLQTYTISADFVIDASGRQAHFAKSLGIKRIVEDKLVACWVTLPNTKTNTMGTISASANGWWYSSVVPRNKRVVAFHTDADLVAKNELKTTVSFLKLAEENPVISELLQEQKGTISFQGTVAANSTKLEQVAGQQWVALGDAALSFDPLSSQGMFNAMASAMQLRVLLLHYGFTEALQKNYTQQMEQIWHHYLKHKSIFYQAETRWKERAFWKRRL
ncbi:dehydrogenase [Flavobacterium jejuense]|uniref:Dehydrogenase n=1 Tax=Flavobacterium jejuense TaxID=1544455 RepID=A0ABX0IUZ8_9FLAO|nr:tryptophan 7-halogenase [Flavobacterium jejuense]NHN27734.1 dehydrogenase [Flavobacterium jejuense]